MARYRLDRDDRVMGANEPIDYIKRKSATNASIKAIPGAEGEQDPANRTKRSAKKHAK
jgi:hypothetical protein